MAILFIFSIVLKNSAFTLCVKRSLISILQFFNSSILLTAYRFTTRCKVKVIAVKVSIVVQHLFSVFGLSGAKVTLFPESRKYFARKMRI
jgi:hypothetical protein